MKLKKIMMSAIAGTMMLSLVACGSKSATQSHKDTAESSSHVTKSKHHAKKMTKVTSSSKKISNNNDDVKVSSTSSSTKTTINGVQNSTTAKSVSSRETQTMNETDARNLVKEHLGNQRANALEAGKGEPNQPTADSIDGFTTKQNGTNDWTVSGTYGGKTYTYHVTPNVITGA
ncbi:hypothetical protein [Limosilactobacillus coleohominis]|uniref:Lipoprotein n=1 Tax=Limosilactobacillus coleohominis TaxID=181675 RepID=A0ABS2H281_9LACO|nr:hypothetical protein [Limosilactobacillus coleohominis]MBM6941203.1 hypothetical protein [Limosilactobacillus coleohominis]